MKNASIKILYFCSLALVSFTIIELINSEISRAINDFLFALVIFVSARIGKSNLDLIEERKEMILQNASSEYEIKTLENLLSESEKSTLKWYKKAKDEESINLILNKLAKEKKLYEESEFNSTAIEAMRIKSGLNKSQLAHEIKVHHTYIGKIEKGKLKPSYEVSKALASCFCVDIDDLIT